MMRNTRGMVLVEVLAYASILAFLINILMAMMVSNGRLNASSASALDRINAAGDIRAQFMKDAREAAKVTDAIATYKTGSDQLVLQLPALPGQPDERRFVVYARIKSPEHLDRLAFTEKAGACSVMNYQTFPLRLEGFRVKYDPASPRQVALEVDATQVGKGAIPKDVRRKPPVTYGFAASMRSIGGAA